MKSKKPVKKAAAKKPVKKAPVKAAATKTTLNKKVTKPVRAMLTEQPIDTKAIQEKYEQCVKILENIHNAITLGLSMTSEFDDKDPFEMVQYGLDQYKEFTNLSPEEVAALKMESQELISQLENAFPGIEIEDERPTTQKKELLN